MSLPKDDYHIILTDYRHDLERLIAIFRSQDDKESRVLLGHCEFALEWAGPCQKQGVLLNKKDITEIIGEAGLHRLLKALSTL